MNGVWGDAIEVPGTAALNTGDVAFVNPLSCAPTGNCLAGRPPAAVLAASRDNRKCGGDTPGGAPTLGVSPFPQRDPG